MNDSIVYALDFDGVICDSAVETAMTGWKAASELWNDMPMEVTPIMIEHFRAVRPLIETGFEAILAMRQLYLGETVSDIYSDYAAKSQNLLKESQVGTDELKKRFGATRDRWIEADLAEWIEMNPLFDGIEEKLQKLGRRSPWYVVTTKQERFVKQILQAHAIELADERIFGLDRNMSKPEVLKELLQSHPAQTIYFAEDRLPTLLNVRKYPELDPVELIFALWGYNTPEDRTLAATQPFRLQRLEDFLET
ncbi:HAD family hydrolase [Methylomicrobium sp. Wu6]|uniref:HAD family hydrolase n=1 Tax=Methylomicrobium sp. Wu6 TaxID=3107928 RepID=UPI002DD6B76D|nr:HAD family hydrolase [Methylomicrobium sp. Wu6]MEC4747855.1 HAD family hydrolase [Methylomicrobium sp. Wu6]